MKRPWRIEFRQHEDTSWLAYSYSRYATSAAALRAAKQIIKARYVHVRVYNLYTAEFVSLPRDSVQHFHKQTSVPEIACPLDALDALISCYRALPPGSDTPVHEVLDNLRRLRGFL